MQSSRLSSLLSRGLAVPVCGMGLIQRRLIALELRRACGGIWFRVALVWALILVLISFVLDAWRYEVIHGWALAFGAAKNYGITNLIFILSWVGTDSQPSSQLFFLMLPFTLLVPHVWSLRQEVLDGYAAHLRTRATWEQCYRAKGFAVFVSSGLVAAVPLMLSLALSFAAAPYGLPDPRGYLWLELPITKSFALHGLFFHAPVAYALVWTVYDFVLAGLWGVAVMGFSRWAFSKVKLCTCAYLFQMIVSRVVMTFNHLLYAQTAGDGFDLFTLLCPLGAALMPTGVGMVVTPLGLLVVAACFRRHAVRGVDLV